MWHTKMAELEVKRNIEEALNIIVDKTNKSGNMKKELNKTIYETVSTLRNLFIKMKVILEEGTKQKHQADKKLTQLKQTLMHAEGTTTQTWR